MITNGRIHTIDEMTTDEYGLRSMSDIDLVDLGMPSGQWELQGLVPLGKALDHVSMYGTDLSGEENTDNMYRMFSGKSHYPRSVCDTWRILQFFRIEYFNGESNKTGGPLALLRGDKAMFYRDSKLLCSGY